MGFRIIGRETELAAVASAWSESDLVTLVGVGGAGKTTLARALAAEASGSVFVDLSGCASAADVRLALGRALRLRHLRGDASDDERIGRSLRRRHRPLIVLDNLEQVVEHSSVTVERWRASAAAHFLVTSRERLRLAAEHVVEVLPLNLEDATTLFRTRPATGASGSAGDREIGLVEFRSQRRSLHRHPRGGSGRGMPLFIGEAFAWVAPTQPDDRLQDRRVLAARGLPVVIGGWLRA